MVESVLKNFRLLLTQVKSFWPMRQPLFRNSTGELPHKGTMSPFEGKAAIAVAKRHVRFWHKADMVDRA